MNVSRLRAATLTVAVTSLVATGITAGATTATAEPGGRSDASAKIRHDVTVKEVWKNPTFRTHFNAGVLHDGHVFGFDNATFKCISMKDGAQSWSKRGLGKGSLILADNRLVVLADDGRLLLVEANTASYVEKGSVQALTGRCWTPPALAGGRVYVRNHKEIVAYDVKG